MSVIKRIEGFLGELPTDEVKAQWCRTGADAVSVGLNEVAKVVALNIVSGGLILPKRFDYGTIGGATLVGALGAADMVDGKIARFGMRHYGLEPDKEHDEMDSILDKEYYRMMMRAIITRARMEGNFIYTEPC